MDIHTDYLDEKMKVNAPDVFKYLQSRRCSSFTSKDYSFEPHDERHEEFNKRGLNMQNIKTVDDFKQSFLLVDHFTEMKKSCFDDYEIKIHGGNVITIQDYEENVQKMRVCMRKNSYLSKPEQTNELLSLSENEELNPALPKVIQIAQKQRQDRQCTLCD